jgi:hypothetical protein
MHAGVDAGEHHTVCHVHSSKHLLGWILDSGASHHILGLASKAKLLTKPRKLPKGVHIQYGDSTEVHVADSVANVSVSQLVLKDVLLVPNSALRLISVSRLCRDESLTVQFNEYRGTLTYRYGKTIEFKQINGLYFVQSFNDEELTITNRRYDQKEVQWRI